MKPRQPAAQRGVFAILFAVLLVVILAMAGLAIDMGFVYERHGDMKSIANSAALAAAHQLDGTADGVENAVEAAEDTVRGNSWGPDQPADWDDAALALGTSADGPWLDAGSVLGMPDDQIQLYRYVRVDAGALGEDMGTVIRYFPYRADPGAQLASVVSVAGPVMSQMLPLGVCALSDIRHAPRPVTGLAIQELVEHGFRRGVTYNLLRLNPGGNAPASFLVNPLDFPDSGSGVDPANFTHSAVAPFMCSGSIAQPRSNQVYVQQPFPTDLIPELNSRFGYASTCVQRAALPDRNIKDFTQASWLNNNPRTTAQAQQRSTTGGRLVTIADVDPSNPDDYDPSAPALRLREHYGTVWAFARAVRYSATAANHAGSSFRAADIDNLYPVDSGPALATTLSDLTTYLPYNSSFETPSGTFLRYRRILHIPLLQCPVGSDTATVLAVGKFMLTAPASSDASNSSIPAEFGGLLPGAPGSTDTRLYQ